MASVPQLEGRLANWSRKQNTLFDGWQNTGITIKDNNSLRVKE